MARKINIADVGFDKRYYPIHDTHNLYSEGYGRKIHIEDEKTGLCLCGYTPNLANSIDYEAQWGNIVSYLSQPDPDGNLCKRCKQIMLKALKVKEE